MALANGYLGSGKKGKPNGAPTLYGYKKAHLRLLDDGTVVFQPFQTAGGSYEVIGQAECLYTIHWRGFRGTGPTINKNCSCGFHAYKTKDAALEHVSYGLKGNDVLLKTVVSGYFIEHELGYRSERQRVTDIYVGQCIYCQRPARTIELDNGRIYAACLEHATTWSWAHTYVTFEELAAKLKMPDGGKYPYPTVQNIDPTVTPATRYQLDHEGRTEVDDITAANAKLTTKLSRWWHGLFNVTTTVTINVNGEIVYERTKSNSDTGVG